jgi:anti-anti-sigma regulatory factor
VAAPLRLYLEEAKTRGFIEFIFDMADCQGMDSSFMGMIGGLSLDMERVPGAFVMLVALSDYNRHLLRQLGLHDFIDEGEVEIPRSIQWTRLDPAGATALDRARLAYEAHGRLVEIKPENRSRFYEFVKRLVQELLPFLKNEKEDRKDE